MDEPTSGLDPKVRNEVLEEIDQIKEREHPAILFSSHLMGDMERIADRIALINNGRIMLTERKTDLKKKWKKIVFLMKTPGTSGQSLEYLRFGKTMPAATQLLQIILVSI